MQSSNYRLFERAMRKRKQIFCIYDGYRRELCPIILGHSQESREGIDLSVWRREQVGLATRRPVALSMAIKSQ